MNLATNVFYLRGKMFACREDIFSTLGNDPSVFSTMPPGEL